MKIAKKIRNFDFGYTIPIAAFAIAIKTMIVTTMITTALHASATSSNMTFPPVWLYIDSLGYVSLRRYPKVFILDTPKGVCQDCLLATLAVSIILFFGTEVCRPPSFTIIRDSAFPFVPNDNLKIRIDGKKIVIEKEED